MGCFMKEEQQKWFFCISSIFHPIQGLIGNNISGISLNGDPSFIGNKIRIVILALSGQDLELIDPFGIIAKMEFPKHGCLVSSLLKQLRKGDLGGIEGESIVDLPMHVTVLARQYGSSGWSTDRVGHASI